MQKGKLVFIGVLVVLISLTTVSSLFSQIWVSIDPQGEEGAPPEIVTLMKIFEILVSFIWSRADLNHLMLVFVPVLLRTNEVFVVRY